MTPRPLHWPRLAPALLVAITLAAALPARAQPLPGTVPLQGEGDYSRRMVAGAADYLERLTRESVTNRARFWHRDLASVQAYEQSVETNRSHLRRMLGVVEERVAFEGMELVTTLEQPGPITTNTHFAIHAVRWPVLDGITGEGLLLVPARPPIARVIALPDADQPPEMLCGLLPGIAPDEQYARRLADAGYLVLVPTLIDRNDTWSGNRDLKRFTNQPHREWIYRQAFEMGRHVIGYELQRVLAAADWLARQKVTGSAAVARNNVGIIGYGEGGLLAFYAGAIDRRFDPVLVSGHFGNRQQLWEEPIYRNVFGLLTEFGDAELASLIVPRQLIIEHAEVPAVSGPPRTREGRNGAAPGRLKTPDYFTIEKEVRRAAEMTGRLSGSKRIELVYGPEGIVVRPGTQRALLTFTDRIGLRLQQLPPTAPVAEGAVATDEIEARQRRQIQELEDYTQAMARRVDTVRAAQVDNWLRAAQGTNWSAAIAPARARLRDEVIGALPEEAVPLNARSRLLFERPGWRAYEVVFDVRPELFSWGLLLVPRDLREGERRPVVVCQHGLEGVPMDVVTEDPSDPAYGYYKGYAAKLAAEGFVVYAPHNLYRGGDAFRNLQRRANPLGLSLFSLITAQHQALLQWLPTLPFVDAGRIGFYGLSYGGKTAMRVPALLEGYALSICSADFNDWIRKNVTTASPYSYMFTGEYEMPEWNLGHTFNYAEMAALIAPRPFMVERGHRDGVAPDEWVASEFARVRRTYTRLGHPERAEIEYFDGPHSIHGVGTFAFLRRHLNWPTGSGSPESKKP